MSYHHRRSHGILLCWMAVSLLGRVWTNRPRILSTNPECMNLWSSTPPLMLHVDASLRSVTFNIFWLVSFAKTGSRTAIDRRTSEPNRFIENNLRQLWAVI